MKLVIGSDAIFSPLVQLGQAAATLAENEKQPERFVVGQSRKPISLGNFRNPGSKESMVLFLVVPP
jgi:hypothetical protein